MHDGGDEREGGDFVSVRGCVSSGVRLTSAERGGRMKKV